MILGRLLSARPISGRTSHQLIDNRGDRMSDITAFRDEVRSWLEEYCPEGARAGASGETGDAMQRWRDALIEQGWTVPPVSYTHLRAHET